MPTAIAIAAIITGLILYSFIRKRPVNKKRSETIVTNLTVKEFINKYNKKQGSVKGGSLCFFGHWFGKPYDNYHQLEVATFDRLTNTINLTFNEKETLSISNPQDISESESNLTIGCADHIYWKWFSYGNPQTEDNLYFIEINNKDGVLTGRTNTTWYKEDFKDLNLDRPALLWI